jgi:hypothetical protein
LFATDLKLESQFPSGAAFNARRRTAWLRASKRSLTTSLPLIEGRPPCRAQGARPHKASTEIFHFLSFCYCLSAKKGYSMGDCAPTTGGVHNV